MRVIRNGAAVLIWGLVAQAVQGCSGGTSSDNRGTPSFPAAGSSSAGDTSSDASSGSGTSGGSGGPGSTPCDATAAVLGPECITESAAVFVWEPGALYGPAQGSDRFDGTRTSPVASLNRAVSLAVKGNKPLIIVCGGDLLSGLNLAQLKSDLRIVGGYGCPNDSSAWQPKYDRTALVLETLSVTAPYDGHATIEVRNTTAKLTLENFSFAVTTELAKSPYGVQRIGAIFEKANVLLRNVSIDVEAGDAAQFAPFTTPNQYPSADALNADEFAGADGCMVTCAGGEKSAGGKGGVGTGAGQPGSPAAAGGKGGAPADGGSYTCAEYGTQGGQGSDGDAGKDGVGAANFGSIQNGVFVGTPGTSGTGGKVGQGGGGGGPQLDAKGVPGACGGCPGAPGAGGPEGGSSIGILSIDSTVTLERSALKTANGAPGAPGSAGQLGQAGGTTLYFEPDCAGGSGGKGGSGGNGGGGSGGLSIGVLYTGSAPTLTDTTVKIGLPGKGGLGKSQNNGIDGVAAETLELPASKSCRGQAQACSAASDSAGCAAAQGCSWLLTCVSGCQGDADACAKLAGCVFQDNTCQPFGNDCASNATETTCKAGTSCSWGTCTGKTTACEMLSADACAGTPGCALQ